MRRFVPIALLVLSIFAARPGRAQSRDEREIRALIDQSVHAANSMDPKLMQQNLANHSGSGGPFFHPFVASLASVADVAALVGQVMPQLSAHGYSISGPITLRVDKNLAWAAFTWHAEIAFKDGTRRSFDGRSTTTFGREGKSWKITHWHSSLPASFPLTKAALDAESQKILDIERNAWEALRSKQLAALENYFADDASVFIEGSAYRLSGKASLVRGLAAYTETTDLRSFQMLEPQVQLLGDTAVLTYYFTERGSSGGKEFSDAGKISIVFVKQDGGWRALHEHRSINH
jgi:ketosteroid isomerase-like protein